MRILRSIHVFALFAMSVAVAQQPAERGAIEQRIRSYQAQGQLAERDRERDRLLAMRQAMSEAQRASYRSYLRDQFMASGRDFRVLENFEPSTPTNSEYSFSSAGTDGSRSIHSVGSYVVTADTATETGLVRAGERIYFLDWFDGQQITTLRLMKEHPTYDAAKSMVIAAVAAASAQPVLTSAGAGPSGGLTEIILERTWCYGSCPIDELVLRMDGTAVFTGTANTSRQGAFSGSFPKQEFDRLARWLVAEAFLEMKGSYGIPNGDAPTQVIRVARGADRKSVVNNSIESSAILAGMENVIRGVAAEISWQPLQSGIRATVTWKNAGQDWQPLAASGILVYPADGKQEMSLYTDAQGRLEIPLLPGTYRIEPFTFGRSYPKARPPKLSPYLTTVVVQADKYFEADIRFDRETEAASIIKR